jgi:hypothetical protein
VKRAEPPEKASDGEHMEILLSSLDQDNFQDTMPRALLEEFIREQGGDPEALWRRVGPWIDDLLAKRAKRIAGR